MYVEYVPLDRIDDNPYQARRSYYDLDTLAADISGLKTTYPDTAGLIHVPTARVVDTDGNLIPGGTAAGNNRIQLAVGHRRLRAFRRLAENDPDYALFPVILCDLDDAAMARTCWQENEDRVDLSPVEQAIQFQKMAAPPLHWTHTQIAQTLGISRESVSNRIRLLQLPEWILLDLDMFRITERQARAALALAPLGPEHFTRGILYHESGEPRSAREIETVVAQHVDRTTNDVSHAVWDPIDMWIPQYPDDTYPIRVKDRLIVLDTETRACGGCPHRANVIGMDRCTDPICYSAKREAWKAEITGPERAKEIHAKYSGWKRLHLDLQDFYTCNACGLPARLAPVKSGWYSPTSQGWIHVCPWCFRRAGLPDPTETTEDSTAEDSTPVDVSRETAPEPDDTWQLTSPPMPAPRAPEPPRRPGPQARPPERSSLERPDIITIRIEPGSGDSRVIRATMAAETGPGQIGLNSIVSRIGTLGTISDTIQDLIVAYFLEKAAVSEH